MLESLTWLHGIGINSARYVKVDPRSWESAEREAKQDAMKDKKLAEMQSAILSEQLVKKDAEIAGLRAQIANRDAEIVELRAQLANRDAEIVRLNARLCALERVIKM